MATATISRTQEKTGTWSNIFPQETVTEQQSALFVKKLLALAVSNITYLRAIFPEHAFGDRCLEDLNLKVLRDDSSCSGACQVIKWVKGCFDALDKKYLKMIIIGIYVDPKNPDTVIESYTFKFSYAENGGIDIYRNNKKISAAHSAAETKKATIRLLRTIVVLTQTLQSLPDDVMMTMKLLYYDEVTPRDYEPPNFKAAQSEGFSFEEEPMNIKIGDVATNFHTVKLRIKTDAKQFETKDENEEMTESQVVEQKLTIDQEISNEGLDIDEDTPVPMELQSNSIAVMRLNDEDDEEVDCETPTTLRKPADQTVPEPIACDDVPVETPVRPGHSEQAAVPSSASQRSVTGSQIDEDLGVRCPCGCNEDDGLMIWCANCKYWQHGVCFKILNEEEAPERHICDTCANIDDADLQATEPELSGLDEVAIQAICLWRRSLLACTEMNRIIIPTFAKRLGVEITVAQGLINRLEKEGFIKNPNKGKRMGKIVNKDKVEQGFAKYFTKTRLDKQETTQDRTEVNQSASQAKSKEKGKKEKRKIDDIEALAAKTESINITGHRTKIETPSQTQPSQEIEYDVKGKSQRGEFRQSPRFKNKQENNSTNNKCQGKKRVISVADKNHEFEVSDSQDTQDQHKDVHMRKRRKSSVVSRPIMV